jgi:NAD(P)-dependent dehydrogenase (short-subunit alcohol dehydrogenase family)
MMGVDSMVSNLTSRSQPDTDALKLQGRHAVVTGAARGIGAEVCRWLAANGARLTLLGRNRETLQELAESLVGGDHDIALADVTNAAQVRDAVEHARQARGPVAILVNNAGQAESAPFGKTSTDLWDRMLAVNLTGTFNCSQAVLQDMLAAKYGRIVNVASTAGQRGYAYVSAYVAAKHGVIGLTRALALEVASTGVTVNAVCPGYTETDLLRESVARVVSKTGRSESEVRAEFSAGNPQRRFIQPIEVASTIGWLCSDEAGSITGQSISVSGGEVM